MCAKHKGLIISFEGLDNCFKETNYKAFLHQLTNNYSYIMGIPTLSESFPRYNSEWSFPIKQWLTNKNFRNQVKNNPKLVNSLYAADRAAYWSEDNHIDAYKNEYSIFVFDRYDSSKFYNPINRKYTSYTDFMFDNLYAGNPLPDITFVMHMNNFDIFMNLLEEKANRDANELDKEYMHDVYFNLEKSITRDLFSRVNTELHVIEVLNQDGSIKTKEEIALDIWSRFIVSEKFTIFNTEVQNNA